MTERRMAMSDRTKNNLKFCLLFVAFLFSMAIAIASGWAAIIVSGDGLLYGFCLLHMAGAFACVFIITRAMEENAGALFDAAGRRMKF